MIEALHVTHRLRTRGDAAIWCALRSDKTAANVLHFTADNGRGYAIELTRDELVNIATAASRILAATPDTKLMWLEDAVGQVMAQHGSGDIMNREQNTALGVT